MLKKINEVYEYRTNSFVAEIDFNKKTKDAYLVIYRRDDDAENEGESLEKVISILIDKDSEIQELYDVFNTIYSLNIGELKK